MHDEEEKLTEPEEEGRKWGKNLFAALKLQKMQNDPITVFNRWKSYSKTVDDVDEHVPKSLVERIGVCMAKRWAQVAMP
ncbi:unnamed protein product [Phytophthora lilii]|uniref:Unnamed protein product n=1 Tax=Phytophthora lilii TaxID=2077276 RepID=A0A9W6TVM1_9STRA|nr:unnamed protein product [Phytophthora lilii]